MAPRRGRRSCPVRRAGYFFDIDWQEQQLAEHARSDLVSVFILPPSGAALESRLRTRAQDSDEVVQRRLAEANEISHYAEYDYIIVNQDIDESVARVTAILKESGRDGTSARSRQVRPASPGRLDRAYAPDRSAVRAKRQNVSRSRSAAGSIPA